MTAPIKKRDRYVKVDRNAWHAIGWVIAAHVLDDVQDATSWQWLNVLIVTARIVAVFYGLLWLATPARDAD